MFNIHTKEIEFGGKKLSIETGRIARQATGSVLVTYGESVVLCTVTAKTTANPDQDFFPLTVDYREKAYAAGKIPGGFPKREGKPSDHETLVSRLIDRPIRPLFAEKFVNETQVICTVLSHDMENDPDIAAIIGSSAALTISGLPFMGPIGAARVGYIDNKFVLNPTLQEMENSSLDLVVAGTKQGVLMVESEASELSEQIMLDAVTFGHTEFQKVINMIIELAEECAKDPWELPEPPFDEAALLAEIKAKTEEKFRAAYKLQDKQERSTSLSAIREGLLADYAENDAYTATTLNKMMKKVESGIVRLDLLKTKNRIDGRDTKTVRPIVPQIEVLPRAHGSALFTRGETQALVVATLGTGQDEQIIDALKGEYKEHFLLHYNFPPFSVGEVGRTGFPGRREIGHGKLAWRSIHPMMPSKEEFPYTIRIVSEITESNGSSSMATVCGTSLALFDAGVPLKRAVAGIAMGLIKENDEFVVLSDILGDEDHLGDMDFKVAGTEAGITALQMDIKITSITKEIMEIALAQAKEGRMHILGEMAKATTNPRSEVNKNAPRIESFTIDKEKIREVIGTGGKVIREIIEVTGAKIDIDDEGLVKVASNNSESLTKAIEWIRSITDEPEVGVIYDGKVERIMDFGAIVKFMGSKDGLVHISEIAPRRIEKVTDVVKEGDSVKVKVLEIDGRGRVKLSMKVVNQETGEELPPQERKERREKKVEEAS